MCKPVASRGDGAFECSVRSTSGKMTKAVNGPETVHCPNFLTPVDNGESSMKFWDQRF
jgi:hypothetical protein